MPGVCRNGDLNVRKGVTVRGDTTVLTNGRPTANRALTFVNPHPGENPRHPHPPNPFMLNCSKNVLVSGQPMGHQQSIDNCMHSMMTKSEDVLVEA
jgi:hypothetical protein